MKHIHHVILGGLAAALLALSAPAFAAPAGLGVSSGDAASPAILVHHGGGGFGGHYGGGNFGGARFYGGSQFAHSGNWNHGWHGHRGRFYGSYGGYYPYYDDYYYDDYGYADEPVCYYSRRYRARICPGY